MLLAKSNVVPTHLQVHNYLLSCRFAGHYLTNSNHLWEAQTRFFPIHRLFQVGDCMFILGIRFTPNRLTASQVVDLRNSGRKCYQIVRFLHI